MKKVRLYVARGGKKNYVATVFIPPFISGAEPEVLIWGERVFVYRGGDDQKPDNIEGIGTVYPLAYFEAFAYAVPPVPLANTDENYVIEEGLE